MLKKIYIVQVPIQCPNCTKIHVHTLPIDSIAESQYVSNIIKVFKVTIEKARGEFPRVENPDDPEYGVVERDRKRTEWAKKWLGIE